MKEYKIKCFSSADDIDFTELPAAEISEYVWGDDYTPAAAGQLALVPGDAFYLKMSCCEVNPRAVYTGYSVLVCLDSALEFFVDFAGDAVRYINIEMNSAGALLAELGHDRTDRIFVSERLSVTASREGENWCVSVRIPLSLIDEFFGVSPEQFTHGYSFRGNFFKCGNQTEIPHYGMWNPVDRPIPDFHRPEYFGRLIIE